MNEQVEVHWLKDKYNDNVVLLDDDTLWEISPGHRSAAARWIRFSTIRVHLRIDRPTEYCYVLTNSSYGEAVAAKALGTLTDMQQRKSA